MRGPGQGEAGRRLARRSQTSTCSTTGAISIARSAIAFIGTGAPLRSEPFAVIRTRHPASASLAARASGPKPLKMGTKTAPTFAHAITAATVSIAIGR